MSICRVMGLQSHWRRRSSGTAIWAHDSSIYAAAQQSIVVTDSSPVSSSSRAPTSELSGRV